MKTSATETLAKMETELFAKLRGIYGMHSVEWFLNNPEIAPEHRAEIQALENQWTIYHTTQREINAALEIKRRGY